MRHQRTSFLALAGAVALSVAGFAPATAQSKGGGEGQPLVTLRFAISDSESRASDSYVRAFIDEVAGRSDGSVTLEPIWDAGVETPQGFEQGVAHLLVDGKADLALSAGRAWHDVGITALQALQAPFLIADDAHAVAVARSPIADDLLASMADAGITGLALWPEDLRHPVALEPCVGPLVAPSQFAGVTVRAIPSALTTDLIETLGGTHTWVDGYEALVASCDVDAAESGFRQGISLPGHPTFTGDVTFFPKYQVLAANGRIFLELTDEQQEAIRDAAIAVRDRALAEHPSDADAAAAWCAEGGTVVLAGPDSVAAFEAAAKPVFDRLAQDEVIARAVDAIRALKSDTTPVTGPVACDPDAPSSAPVDLSGYLGTDLPNGSFRAVITQADLDAKGASPTFASGNWGTKTWTFDDGSVTFDQGEHGGGPCSGTSESVAGSFVRMVTTGGDCGIEGEYVWKAVDGGILLQLSEDTTLPARDVADVRAFLDRTWIRIEGEPPSP